VRGVREMDLVQVLRHDTMMAAVSIIRCT
jgi:hypothetical protein